jgi:sensor c-di-GMP phosphodiesterase-like protein
MTRSGVLSANRKQLLAVTIGVAAAIAAAAVVALWLQGQIERRGQEEVELSARRSIRLAEWQIDSALATLDDLAARGVAGCSGGDLDALRRAEFFNASIKGIAVVAADGDVLCGSSNVPLKPYAAALSRGPDGAGKVSVGIVRIGDRGAMVRVQRRGAGANGLVALIPAELFSVLAWQQGLARSSHILITTSDGLTVVDRGGAPQGGRNVESFTATRQSGRYRLAATVTLPRAALRGEIERLRAQALVFGATIAILILAIMMLVPRRRRGDPIAEFERAIAANEFIPYYQPVVDIRTGRLRGAEVLARWRKPDGSLQSPAIFIPFAESTGLIIPLTRAVMRHVCQEIGELIGLRPDIKISFNLAAPHFADESIVADVREIFGNSLLPLRQVVLEVTERQPLENLAGARRIIASLQDLGCGVAIDDVGTGHGGLSYILKLGADTIKIDKLFIDAMGTERHSTTILETLVDLARSMRMDVVAEGVESFEQVLQLRDLGILAAQGHVFCPPLPGPSFVKLVEAIAPVGRPDSAMREGDKTLLPAPGAAAA